MATRVLVPMDDSGIAERALEFALDEHPNAESTVLHVAGGPLPMMGSHSGSLSDRLFRGNVAEKVFRRSPVPVTSVR